MLVFGALHKHAHGFSGATASPHQEVGGLHTLPWSLVVALIIAGALFTIAAVALPGRSRLRRANFPQ